MFNMKLKMAVDSKLKYKLINKENRSVIKKIKLEFREVFKGLILSDFR